jgi:predicted Zn finger-like uncharacterized protein
MSIHVKCPKCSTAYTLPDDNAGKKARCKKCGEKFRMPAAGDMAEALPVSDVQDTDRPRRKKRLKGNEATPLHRKPAVWAAGGALAFILLAIGLALLLRGARGPVLVGKWRGAPEVREAVKAATSQVAKGQQVNPLVQGFVQAMVQKGAEQLLAVEVDFKQSGTAYYSGNTAIIDMPQASDSPWQIVKVDGDIMIVRLGRPDKSFEARLAFRDRDTFSFTRLDAPGADPISFTRFGD